ncbi:MAG: hypothetical protein K1X47_01755 [Cyclobacteriaceae bacterium]|nr:hypothetical protein [Cyclobacteriaceae bacterium]
MMPARLHLVSGFLGSGKSTLIRAAAQLLQLRDMRVAVITNDQGEDQVDTAWMEAGGIPARQVANGCFCCRLQDLVDQLDELAALNPEVIFAESVGSCTDVVATVVRPLQRRMPDLQCTVTTLTDACLLQSVISGTSAFVNDDVRYIFHQQLQEASVILLNKLDLLSRSDIAPLVDALQLKYPMAKVGSGSALHESLCLQWLEILDDSRQNSVLQEIDYERYAAGEAALAWFDAQLTLTGAGAGAAIATLAQRMIQSIRSKGWPVGHLKLLATGASGTVKVSMTSTQHDEVGHFTRLTDHALTLTINARVMCLPEELRTLLMHTIGQLPVAATVVRSRAFAPGYPIPAERITE